VFKREGGPPVISFLDYNHEEIVRHEALEMNSEDIVKLLKSKGFKIKKLKIEEISNKNIQPDKSTDTNLENDSNFIQENL
jgi:nucleoside diphosphate kinase